MKHGCCCEECQLDLQPSGKYGSEKATVYELLRTGMVGGPAHVFTRYHEKDITYIRSHMYRRRSTLTKGTMGYDANTLYLYYSGDECAVLKTH